MCKITFTIINILLVICLGACSDRPSNAIDEGDMVSLLADMQLTEAYAGTKAMTSNDKIELGKKVLQEHGVSQESLDTTLAWYGRNIDEYSELFEKVNKEINKRRGKYSDVLEERKVKTNYWPYSSHQLISELSGSDAFVFSIPNPGIEKGDLLNFTFHLPNPVSMKNTFGVEYTDGSGEISVTSHSSGLNGLKVSLQTDTGRKVARIFGVMQLKDLKKLPVYIDSISLKSESLDTLSYQSKRRIQKKFGSFGHREL